MQEILANLKANINNFNEIFGNLDSLVKYAKKQEALAAKAMEELAALRRQKTPSDPALSVIAYTIKILRIWTAAERKTPKNGQFSFQIHNVVLAYCKAEGIDFYGLPYQQKQTLSARFNQAVNKAILNGNRMFSKNSRGVYQFRIK